MIKLCDFGSATTETHFPDRTWSAIQRSLVEDEVIIKLICFDPFNFSFFFPIWLMLHSQSTFGKGYAVILNQVSRSKVKKVWVDFRVKSFINHILSLLLGWYGQWYGIKYFTHTVLLGKGQTLNQMSLSKVKVLSNLLKSCPDHTFSLLSPIWLVHHLAAED